MFEKKVTGFDFALLRGYNILVPNKILSEMAQKILFDLGATWYSGKGMNIDVIQYKKDAYIHVNGEGCLSYGSIPGSGEEREDINVEKLTEIISSFTNKPSHTLMTAEELLNRKGEMEDLEGALRLSIDKWERLIKEDNWPALISTVQDGNKDNDFVGSSTCALCAFMKSGCVDCPLRHCGEGSYFRCASEALIGQKQASFYAWGVDLINEMKCKLEDLKEPTYQIGDHFLYNNSFYVLVLLEKEDHKDTSKIIFVNMHSGDRRSSPTVVEDCFKITKKELSSQFSGKEVKKVDVEIKDITVKGGEEK